MRALFLTVFASAALSGCGSKTENAAGAPSDKSDEGQILRVIWMVNDDKSTGGTLKRHFAEGLKLSAADLKKFAAYAIDIKGKPKVNGDTATATIAFKLERGETDAGEKEWEFVKESGGWKIKAAPLP